MPRPRRNSELAEITSVDPVEVDYGVPWSIRMQALALVGAKDVQQVFAQTVLTLELPDGSIYPIPGQPEYESARIDPQSGTIMVRALFDNPDNVLVPGLEVRVHSQVGAASPALR